jgi:predicted lipoprotein with Yx(FWY)xxD motif
MIVLKQGALFGNVAGIANAGRLFMIRDFASVLRIGLAAAAVALAVPTMSRAEPPHVADVAKGKALVDAKGMTLYTFDRDSAGKSSCSGPCASQWPPALAAASDAASGDWTLISRDGGKQWAHKGKPLYTWKDDKKPGDTTGDDLNGVWHVARP